MVVQYLSMILSFPYQYFVKCIIWQADIQWYSAWLIFGNLSGGQEAIFNVNIDCHTGLTGQLASENEFQYKTCFLLIHCMERSRGKLQYSIV